MVCRMWPGEVEGQVLLQPVDRAPLLLVARLRQLLQGVVRALHVRRVVLVVVQLDDLGADHGRERGVVVRQFGQRVDGHGGFPSDLLLHIACKYTLAATGPRWGECGHGGDFLVCMSRSVRSAGARLPLPLPGVRRRPRGPRSSRRCSKLGAGARLPGHQDEDRRHRRQRDPGQPRGTPTCARPASLAPPAPARRRSRSCETAMKIQTTRITAPIMLSSQGKTSSGRQ